MSLSLYVDGGVFNVNPSPWGGAWAWRQVEVETDTVVREESGFVTPADISLPTVTNNLTELLAMIRGLQSMPEGWSGNVYSDSGVTVGRTEGIYAFKGIPPAMVEELTAAKKRLGRLNIVLLGGHPNREELRTGIRKDGKPVSRHNVHCDQVCKGHQVAFMANRVKQGVQSGG